jgi:hypothetical protein
MSMTLSEAIIWDLRQMAESPYYATRHSFLNLIADKLQNFEDTKREVDVLRSILDRICDITGDLKHTNENVVAGVERLKSERDGALEFWMKTHNQQNRDEDWSALSGQVVGGERDPLPPKDAIKHVGLDYSMNWALSLLRFSSVTDWPDPIDYACWVRNVAAAGAMGEDWRLFELEKQMQEQARNYPHRKK